MLGRFVKHSCNSLVTYLDNTDNINEQKRNNSRLFYGKYVKRAEPTVEVFICSDQTKTDIIKGCYVAVLEYESHLPMFTDLLNEYLGKRCQRSFITDPVV